MEADILYFTYGGHVTSHIHYHQRLGPEVRPNFSSHILYTYNRLQRKITYITETNNQNYSSKAHVMSDSERFHIHVDLNIIDEYLTESN